MVEAEGLTPPVKWGQVGRAVTLGGPSDRPADCLRSPLNSNMAAAFKRCTAEGRGRRRVPGRGRGAPPLIFQLIY